MFNEQDSALSRDSSSDYVQDGPDSKLTPKKSHSPKQDLDSIGLPRPGLARHNAPETSKWAARLATPYTGNQRTQILAALRDAGSDGLTDDEGEELLGIVAQSFTPRRGELAGANLIAVLPGSYRKTRMGRAARVWVAVEFLPKPEGGAA